MNHFKRSSESTTQILYLPTPSPMIMSHDHSDLYERLPKLKSKMTPRGFELLKKALQLQMARKMGNREAASEINREAAQRILANNYHLLNRAIPGPIASQNPGITTIVELLQHRLDEQAKQHGCTQGWTTFFIQQIQFLSPPLTLRGDLDEKDKLLPDGSVDYHPDDLTVLNWTYVENGVSSTLNPELTHAHRDYDLKRDLVHGIDYLISQCNDSLTSYPADAELSCADISISLACGVWFYSADFRYTVQIDGAPNSKGNALRHDFNHRKSLRLLLPMHATPERIEAFTRSQWAFLSALTDDRIAPEDASNMMHTHFSLCHEYGISSEDLLTILQSPEKLEEIIFKDGPIYRVGWVKHCFKYINIQELQGIFSRDIQEELRDAENTQKIIITTQALEPIHKHGISRWSAYFQHLYSTPKKTPPSYVIA